MRYNVKLAGYDEGEFMQDSRSLTPTSPIEVKLIPKMRGTNLESFFLPSLPEKEIATIKINRLKR